MVISFLLQKGVGNLGKREGKERDQSVKRRKEREKLEDASQILNTYYK